MTKQIFVGNLSPTVTIEELQKHFAPLGEITQATILQDRETGRSRGFGFITFSTETAAQKAIDTMHGKMLAGHSLRVALARPFVRKQFKELPSEETSALSEKTESSF